ncbi:MAG: hypothetical protein EBQ57_00205, partial [Actinobacteria bacterium]|nr:hypothetical protein [Actinomycetota bacterium]
PRGMSLVDAAAIPEVFITAWDALILQGGLTPGGTALVHAGASGVGTAAIQICRAMGARIIVTCSGARGSVDKVAACRALGASLVVDYTTHDFAKEVADFTQGRGVDVVLDVIGGDYTARNVACLARRVASFKWARWQAPQKTSTSHHSCPSAHQSRAPCCAHARKKRRLPCRRPSPKPCCPTSTPVC